MRCEAGDVDVLDPYFILMFGIHAAHRTIYVSFMYLNGLGQRGRGLMGRIYFASRCGTNKRVYAEVSISRLEASYLRAYYAY